MSRETKAQRSFCWDERAGGSREGTDGSQDRPATQERSAVESETQATTEAREEGPARPPGLAPERRTEGAGPGDGPPPFLTVREAAALLRTTPKAIYHRAERGLLPGLVHDGRRLLVRRQELLRSLAEVRVPSPGGHRR
jgi:Helix-turn-helix domain